MRAASPSLVCLAWACACAGRASSQPPRREAAVAVAQRHDGDAAAPVTATPLRRAEQLPAADGVEVTICGEVRRLVPGARDGVTAYGWAGLRLAGDAQARVYFDPPAGFDARDGDHVCATGRYWREEPAHPGDPPYASRRRGSWLVEPRDVRLEAVDVAR